MAPVKTEGIVLRKVDFGDTSSILTFLTPDKGRIACLAKGLRRKNSPYAGILDTFNCVDLVYYWKDGRGVQTLAEVSLLNAQTMLKRDVARITYASLLLECALKAAGENDPSEALYEALQQALSTLGDVAVPVGAGTAYGLYRMISATGHEPLLDTCADTGEPPSAARSFSFEAGLMANKSGRPIAAPAILALARMTLAVLPPEEEAEEILTLMTGFAARHLETDFRSMRVIRQMFGETAYLTQRNSLDL